MESPLLKAGVELALQKQEARTEEWEQGEDRRRSETWHFTSVFDGLKIYFLKSSFPQMM